MALDITQDQGKSVSRRLPIMKTTPQRHGPNGLRVVKNYPSPRLGDGLCDVFSVTVNSPAQTDDTFNSSIDHETNSSIFTPSERASTMSSTPNSSAGSFDFDLPAGPGDNIPTPRRSLFEAAYCEPPQSTLSEKGEIKPAFHTTPPLSLAESTSAVTSPSPKLLQLSQIFEQLELRPYATPSRISKEQIAQDSPVPAPAIHQVDPWFHGEALTNLEAGVAVKASQYCAVQPSQYWDLLNVLDVQPKPCEKDQVDISQSPRALQYSERFPPNPLYTNVRLLPQSRPGMLRDRFYAKLGNYSDMNHTRSSTEAESNVHVFVDMSNIFVGFCESYKISKQIPLASRVPIPSFSFKTLALVMERARNVKKRVLAGSIYGVVNTDSRASWPSYFFEAERLDYKMNVFSRVQKRKITPTKSKGRGRTPTDETDKISDDVTYEVRNGEQGVDENLHLNMMDSMWDNMSNPGTMVLATGDAAEAEFSGGFLQYAIRALEKGWKLELVTWKRPLSSAWTDPKFMKKYEHQFSIIFLDEFLEELHTSFLE
ncbi:hypothetical protein F5Y11DRAFT_352808 [Daldinia sp. FL1419]|nr:hypothetical protein F5Y11DRAFT_352808 [Daldinia sp. FL1419]